MATIRDVARASKISVATVSRVFNESPRVSEATRLRVVTAANLLGYWRATDRPCAARPRAGA